VTALQEGGVLMNGRETVVQASVAWMAVATWAMAKWAMAKWAVAVAWAAPVGGMVVAEEGDLVVVVVVVAEVAVKVVAKTVAAIWADVVRARAATVKTEGG